MIFLTEAYSTDDDDQDETYIPTSSGSEDDVSLNPLSSKSHFGATSGNFNVILIP